MDKDAKGEETRVDTREWRVVGEKNREISGGVTDENQIGGS